MLYAITLPSPATATRLARLARLRAWLDTNGNLRLSRSLATIESKGVYALSQEKRDALVSFFSSEAPCRLYRDLMLVTLRMNATHLAF
jgi:hypothetical protein